MAGLLDGFGEFARTPEGQGLLSAVFGGLAGARRGAPLNSLGTAGLAGLQGYSGALDRNMQTEQAAQMGKYRDAQIQDFQAQADQRKAQTETLARQQSWKAGLPAVMDSKTYGAGDEGPTMAPDNAGIQKYLLSPDSPYADKMMEQKLFPKPQEAFTLSDGQTRYGTDGKPIAQLAPKPAAAPSAIQEYEYAKAQGYNGSYQQWTMEGNNARAPKTSVSVNTSDPTAMAKAGMDFQDKFRTATKDSFTRAQAYEAMTEAAKNPSAKGDLTMVYSMVKALDPTSVVREGEISLLNSNRSVPDSIKGYAQRLATGQSLLPNEREDMLNQVKTLTETDYRRSRNDIKAYRDNAQRLTLDPELYAPDPYSNYEKNQKKAKATEAMPPAQQHKGKMIRDTVTGKTLKSDGMTWKEVP